MKCCDKCCRNKHCVLRGVGDSLCKRDKSNCPYRKNNVDNKNKCDKCRGS